MTEADRGKTLRDVAIGETATVRRLTGAGAIKRHIMDMGITKGTDVYVRKVAPLHSHSRSSWVRTSLRKNEAETILVG